MAEWSVEQVCAWLREVELGQLSDNFAQHDIAGALLFQLTAGEIATDLGVDKLADRKRLAAEIAALRRRDRWWVRWWASVLLAAQRPSTSVFSGRSPLLGWQVSLPPPLVLLFCSSHRVAMHST